MNDDARVALVTGASRGLGYAVARALGSQGWQVIALARTVGGLEDLADEILANDGPNPTLVPLSITDDGGLQRLCLALDERWGRLDLVVHCAAHAAPRSPAPHIADKDFTASLETNARGVERLIVMLAPLLSASEAGQFIYVTDSRSGAPFFGAYGATKAAGEALARSWAAETARIGPNVSFFEPNPMPTAIRARFFPGEASEGLSPCEVEAERLIAAANLEPTARVDPAQSQK